MKTKLLPAMQVSDTKPFYTAEGWGDRIANAYSTDENGCWIWNCSKRTNGYGLIYANVFLGGMRRQVKMTAHVVSFFAATGVWPKHPQQLVCHHCDVRLCINPEHLYLGTSSSNARDAWLRNEEYRASRMSYYAEKIYRFPKKISESLAEEMERLHKGSDGTFGKNPRYGAREPSVRALAQTLGLPITTTHRILKCPPSQKHSSWEWRSFSARDVQGRYAEMRRAWRDARQSPDAVWNYQAIAKKYGVSVDSVKRALSVLEARKRDKISKI